MSNHKLNEKTKRLIYEIAKEYKDIVVVDVSNHLYKYYYTHSRLSISNEGVTIPTGHIYGFLRLICTLRSSYDNPAIILCVDGYDKERKQVDSSYKANRDKKSFNLHADTGKVLEMLSLFKGGIYISHHPDYEADDTMYSVCTSLDRLLKKNNLSREIYICSNDRDMCQCVNDNIKIVKGFGKKGKIKEDADMIDYDGVMEEFNGVIPENFAKYRALIGDSSDNIKGYPRILKKVASKFANYGEFGEDGMVYERDDLSLTESGWIQKVNQDYHIFKSNLQLTQLKDYPFTLERPTSDRAWELVDFYKMNSFKREVTILERMR